MALSKSEHPIGYRVVFCRTANIALSCACLLCAETIIPLAECCVYSVHTYNRFKRRLSVPMRSRSNCFDSALYSTNFFSKLFVCSCLKRMLTMSRKVMLGQKNSQSTIVGFLAKTTNKNDISRTR